MQQRRRLMGSRQACIWDNEDCRAAALPGTSMQTCTSCMHVSAERTSTDCSAWSFRKAAASNLMALLSRPGCTVMRMGLHCLLALCIQPCTCWPSCCCTRTVRHCLCPPAGSVYTPDHASSGCTMHHLLNASSRCVKLCLMATWPQAGVVLCCTTPRTRYTVYCTCLHGTWQLMGMGTSLACWWWAFKVSAHPALVPWALKHRTSGAHTRCFMFSTDRIIC